MNSIAAYILIILEGVVFGSIALLHITKNKNTAIWAYVAQSCAVVAAFFATSKMQPSFTSAFMIAGLVGVKIIFAPSLFLRLIKKNKFGLSARSHLSPELSLLAVVTIFVLVWLALPGVPAVLAPLGTPVFVLATTSIFISLLLLVNRKGAFSQVLGILSLENSIILFSLLAGFEQNPALELGIIFDIFIWMIVASVLTSKIYAHFGSLDVTEMKKLTD